MARLGECGNNRGGMKWTTYNKRTTTTIICSLNLAAALYLLYSLFTPFLFFNNAHDPSSVTAARYTTDQIKLMEESIRVRTASEPLQLVRLVEEIKKGSSREEVLDLPQLVKQKIADEILQRLKDLKLSLNASEQRAIETWRREKLEEIKKGTVGKGGPNSTSTSEEAKMLERALESDWIMLLENIGLWIPDEIMNKEEDSGKFESEQELEDQIVPGRPIPPECHAELQTDYDGVAVRWGLTHHKESAADCCQACLDQAKHAKPGESKCNIWVYCPSESGCYSPDIYEHKHQECWLKQADKPKLNFKNKYAEWYRNSHPTAPVVVPWISGIVGT